MEREGPKMPAGKMAIKSGLLGRGITQLSTTHHLARDCTFLKNFSCNQLNTHYSPPDYAEVTGGHRAAVSNEDDGKRVNDEGAEAAVPPPEYSTLFVEGEREQGD